MKPLKIFSAFGIELEYMIVNKDTLSVLPVTDKVFFEQTGEFISDVPYGEMEWSNELALHVIELKTAKPASDLSRLPGLFSESVLKINTLLEKMNGMIMPTAMHPLMEPIAEMKLWPHDSSPIYDAYNRIFDCKGHGWANLQSMHINFPFSGDEEFGKLHAAIRLILPILPALAASSPIAEGKLKESLDHRLEVYRKNQIKVPLIVGKIIPEPVFTKKAYEKKIFEPLYKAISSLDPEGVLQEEWLNSRGAIARFDRNAIEIRLIDMQECPAADVSIAAFVIELVKLMAAEQWCSFYEQQTFNEDHLAIILLKCIKGAETAVIDDRKYLKAFGYPKEKCTAGEFLNYLFEKVMVKSAHAWALEPLKNIIRTGSLSTRILKQLNGDFSEDHIKFVYRKLCDCAASNKIFTHV